MCTDDGGLSTKLWTSAERKITLSSCVCVCVSQEFFQGLESHMILTEMYFSKSSALMLPKERQALEETLAEAQSVLKEAHSKGVELEFILEVRDRKLFLFTCCSAFQHVP